MASQSNDADAWPHHVEKFFIDIMVQENVKNNMVKDSKGFSSPLLRQQCNAHAKENLVSCANAFKEN